jgi:hypothetical protein
VSRKALVTVNVPYRNLEARIKPDIASIRTRKVSDKEFEITVAPRTDMREGPFEGELTVELIDEQGIAVEAGWLPVEGELRAEVRPIPARLILPATAIGQTAVGMFLLQAQEDIDMVVASIDTDALELHIEPAKVQGVQEGRAYQALLKVVRAGDYSTVARFTIRRASQEPMVYRMEIICRGLAAERP